MNDEPTRCTNLWMLFSLLIASVSAAPGFPVNDCEFGAVPNQYVVTLQEPPPSRAHSRPRSLDTQDTVTYIQDWLYPYNPEYTSNGRRKLAANADSPLVLHVFTAIEPAVAINASNEVRHTPSTRTHMSSSTSATRLYLTAPHAHRIRPSRSWRLIATSSRLRLTASKQPWPPTLARRGALTASTVSMTTRSTTAT